MGSVPQKSRSALRQFGWLLKQAVIASHKDNILGTAKGAAYSALLAVFPVLSTVTALLLEANAEAVARLLSGFVQEALPSSVEPLVRDFFSRGNRPAGLLVSATLLSLWAASGVVMSLIQGFEAAYRVPRGRPFVRQRAVAMSLVIAIALPALGASGLILAGNEAESWLLRGLGLLPRGEQLRGGLQTASQLLRSAVALLSLAASLSVLYYYGPHRERRHMWRRVWPGAVLTTCLWYIATQLFGWYTRNVANYSLVYGGIGAVIALLVWMYVLSVVVLYGCEFNAELERAKLTAAAEKVPARV